MAAAAALASAGGPRVFLFLAYDRAAILHGQWWRLITSHLVHAQATHLLWNLAATALVTLAVAPALRAGAWLAAGLAVALGSSLGVLLLQPEVHLMAGLSGLLHGLLAAGAAAQVRQGERVGWVYLALLAAKIAWEQMAGPSPALQAALGGRIATGAHALGAAIGLAAGLVLPIAGRRTARPA